MSAPVRLPMADVVRLYAAVGAAKVALRGQQEHAALWVDLIAAEAFIKVRLLRDDIAVTVEKEES